eukprot:6213653-Pleurochrysis_carterae.AAC.2
MACPKGLPIAAVFRGLAGSFNKHPSLHVIKHLRHGPLFCRQPVFDARILVDIGIVSQHLNAVQG